MLVGADVNNPQSDYFGISATGGTNSVTLTERNIPKHLHDVNLKTENNGSHSHSVTYFDYFDMRTRSASPGSYPALVPSNTVQDTISQSTTKAGQHLHKISGKTGLEGSDILASIDNRQPYYVATFIVYLGQTPTIDPILVG